MRTPAVFATVLSLFATQLVLAQQATEGPYHVLKRANVGGEGSWDYLYADADGRRLYIIRKIQQPEGAPATAATAPAPSARLSIYDLDTLQLVGEIAGIGGQGTAVDPKSGHGFTSSKPISMFDPQTMKLLKTIDVPEATEPDGIYFDPSDERVYVFSHPTQDATVIDAKDGSLVGTIKLGGRPEQAIADGKGHLYVVLQEDTGRVAVVDEKAMQTVRHFSLDNAGRCNGLALDARHQVLFAACARSNTHVADANGFPFRAINPIVVVLRATDGKILAKEPLTGGADGAVFNPKTMETYVTTGNGMLTVVKEKSPTSFAVEQNVPTMNGARTITFDTKTQHLFTMADQRGPMPPQTPGGRPRFPPAVPGTFTILEIGR